MNILEILAAISTVLCVYLTYRSNILCWPFGIIGVILYSIIFGNNSNWINMSLQIVFLIQSIIGWVKWNKNTKISHLNGRPSFIISLVFSIILPIVLYNISIFFSGSDSILDSLTSSLSLFGIYLTSNRKIESWIVWGICDILMIVLFLKSGLYFSSFIYLILLILCIFGYYNWKIRTRIDKLFKKIDVQKI